MTQGGDEGGRWTERDEELRMKGDPGNPSAGVSEEEEGMMTGRSYSPQGGEG